MIDLSVMVSSSSATLCSLLAAFAWFMVKLSCFVRLEAKKGVPVKMWLILSISSTPTTSLIPFGIWLAMAFNN